MIFKSNFQETWEHKGRSEYFQSRVEKIGHNEYSLTTILKSFAVKDSRETGRAVVVGTQGDKTKVANLF